MHNKKKWITIFVISFSMITIVALTTAIISRDRNFDSRSSAAEDINVKQNEITGIPRVVSIDPASAYVGEEFNYFLKVVDSDTPRAEITVMLVNAPNWMYLDPTEFRLYGYPRIDSSDTVKVELMISDGVNRVEHKFFMLVLEQDE